MTAQEQREWREYLRALRRYVRIELANYIEDVEAYIDSASRTDDSGSNPPSPPPPPPHKP